MKQALFGLAAGMLVFASVGSRADQASGSYTNTFTGNLSVWDLSGTYTENVEGILLNYTVNVDPSGKFTGQGTASVNGFQGYNMNLNMDLSFNGKVTTAGNATRVTMTMKMKGGGTMEGYGITFRASANENVEVDGANRQLVGRMSGSVSVAVPSLHRHASAPFRTTVDTALPPGATGDWTLTVNLAPNGKKYSGNASASWAGGKTVNLTATGNYVTKSDTTRLTLKGRNAVSLAVTACCANDQMNLKRLNGKLLGQKVKLVSP